MKALFSAVFFKACWPGRGPAILGFCAVLSLTLLAGASFAQETLADEDGGGQQARQRAALSA